MFFFRSAPLHSQCFSVCARLSLPAFNGLIYVFPLWQTVFECDEQTESICFYISNGYVSIDTIPNQSQHKMCLTTGFEVECEPRCYHCHHFRQLSCNRIDKNSSCILYGNNGQTIDFYMLHINNGHAPHKTIKSVIKICINDDGNRDRDVTHWAEGFGPVIYLNICLCECVQWFFIVALAGCVFFLLFQFDVFQWSSNIFRKNTQ